MSTLSCSCPLSLRHRLCTLIASLKTIARVALRELGKALRLQPLDHLDTLPTSDATGPRAPATAGSCSKMHHPAATSCASRPTPASFAVRSRRRAAPGCRQRRPPKELCGAPVDNPMKRRRGACRTRASRFPSCRSALASGFLHDRAKERWDLYVGHIDPDATAGPISNINTNRSILP